MLNMGFWGVDAKMARMIEDRVNGFITIPSRESYGPVKFTFPLKSNNSFKHEKYEPKRYDYLKDFAVLVKEHHPRVFEDVVSKMAKGHEDTIKETMLPPIHPEDTDK